MSVVTRKSWQDLRRRKARSLFTLATIGFAVAGLVTLVAMPQLMDRAVEKHINSLFSKLGLSEEPDVHRRVKAVLLFLAVQEGG